MADERVRRRVVVHGRVQGVGFRYSARRVAVGAGVDGWVRNRGDGTVEAVLEGPPGGGSARVVDFMREGPRGAEVTDVKVSNEEEPEGLRGVRGALSRQSGGPLGLMVAIAPIRPSDPGPRTR